MHVVHLTASTFFGGPERQMLGLAQHLPPEFSTSFLSFSEGGRCGEFLRAVEAGGFAGIELHNDTPRLRAAARELAGLLRFHRADVLLCHGYKANLLGRVAARRAGVPVVAVSRGWTGENWKVRRYEALDRWHLKLMDHVVCVSDGQAAKVRRCGVPQSRMSVIRNAARLTAFADPDVSDLARLTAVFPGTEQVSPIVVAAGRLSPEKGFDVFVEAAARVAKLSPSVGFVLFGEGPERSRLEGRVREIGLSGRFVMPGFTRELDRFLPWADVLVIPSHTEGLPNVGLEASAAGVPVVATAVGGNPEVVVDELTGYLVPPARPDVLAERLARLVLDERTRHRMGGAARDRMHAEFTFDAQASAYADLFERLCRQSPATAAA
jgi:glycosyltransferase involved in cell wall biosynthesis